MWNDCPLCNSELKNVWSDFKSGNSKYTKILIANIPPFRDYSIFCDNCLCYAVLCLIEENILYPKYEVYIFDEFEINRFKNETEVMIHDDKDHNSYYKLGFLLDSKYLKKDKIKALLMLR